MDHRAQRWQPDPSSGDDHVRPEVILQRPRLAERPPQAQAVTHRHRANGAGDIAHKADGVVDTGVVFRVRADRDGSFTHPGHVEHVELARVKAVLLAKPAIDEGQPISGDIAGFTCDGFDLAPAAAPSRSFAYCRL